MRVLQLIDHLGCGGAQVVLSDMLAHWPDPSDSLHVVSLGRKNPLAGRLRRESGVEVTNLDCHKWDVSAVGRVSDIICRGRFDIVHAHLGKATAAALLAPIHPTSRLVVHLHIDPTPQPILRAALHWLGHRAAAMIAVSEHTAQAARNLGLDRHTRLETLPNGISLSRLKSSPAKGDVAPRLRQRAGIPPEAFLLGFVGRLATQKGVTFLLRALQGLDPRVMVVVLGEGPLQAALQREARRRDVADRVRFVGFQSDIIPWLSSCDALVLPSLAEGLPITVLEACALRRPVIATRVGGVAELLTDGESGLLVPPRDVEALRNAIQRLSESASLRSRLTVAARERVERFFSADRLAADVRELYGQLRATSRAPDAVALG